MKMAACPERHAAMVGWVELWLRVCRLKLERSNIALGGIGCRHLLGTGYPTRVSRGAVLRRAGIGGETRCIDRHGPHRTAVVLERAQVQARFCAYPIRCSTTQVAGSVGHDVVSLTGDCNGLVRDGLQIAVAVLLRRTARNDRVADRVWADLTVDVEI